MQRKELIEVIGRVTLIWQNAPVPSPEAAALWWDTLKDVELPLALAGVESLHREGKEFAPTAGMILRRTVELQLDPPDWADTARELGKCLSYGERVYRKGEFHDDRAGRLEQAPLSVREFVRSVGWRQIEGWESDTAAEAQLRNKWSAFVARTVEDRTLLGLEAPGARRLERVNGPRHLSETLKALEQAR